MPLHRIGRVGIVFFSEWEAQRVYSYLDYVRTGGNTYMCVAEHLSDELNKPSGGADSTFWRVIIDNDSTKTELLQTLRGELPAIVNENYYNKAQINEKVTELNAKIDGKMKMFIVDELPQSGESGAIYLIATGAEPNNEYDEYVWLNKGDSENTNFVWEKLGTQKIDLSDYYSKSAVDDMLNLKTDKTQTAQILDMINNLTDNDTIYDDSAVVARIEALENKVDNDTIYDDTELRAKITELENRTDNDTIYDDSAIKSRISALEARTDNDTIYDDSALSGRVSAIETSLANLGSNLDTNEVKTIVYDLLKDYGILQDKTETMNNIIGKIVTDKVGTITFRYNGNVYKHPQQAEFDELTNTLRLYYVFPSEATSPQVKRNDGNSHDIVNVNGAGDIGVFKSYGLTYGFYRQDGENFAPIAPLNQWDNIDFNGGSFLDEFRLGKYSNGTFYHICNVELVADIEREV